MTAFRLTFMLPASIALLGPIGRHAPSRDGCELTVGRGGLVEIAGPSRLQVFDQARRLLRVVCKDRPAMSITATLWTPAAYYGRGTGGRDGWSIIVNSEISFSPTSLEPVLDRETAGAGA